MQIVNYNTLAEDYDFLYSQKDYLSEVKVILEKIKNSKNILDVGCGTGIHYKYISESGKDVVGIDPSLDMINKAKNNNPKNSNLFFNQTVEQHSTEALIKYDAIISMFNVVNHIACLEDLISFFNACYSLLESNGVMVFDCWNSIACAIEKPFKEQKKVIDGTIIKYKTTTDLLNSTSQTTMFFNNKEISLTTHMWSPRILKEIVEYVGFSIEETLNFRKTEKIATEKDHRILFVIKKIQ